MKKNILFVIDERRMGGVSVLLDDMLRMISIKNYNIDILCLHDNGEMLTNLPKNVKMIFGTPYFEAIDYTYKEVLKSKNVKLIFKKIRVIFDMKTGRIEKRIKQERKKILQKNYDVEIAFKDGFTAIFTAFGNSKKKIHWLHYEYVKTNPNAKYEKLMRKVLPLFDKIVAVSDGVMNAFNDIYHLEKKTIVINNLVDTNKIVQKSKEEREDQLDAQALNIMSVGRIHPMKGYPRLIEAFYQLKKEKKLPYNFIFRLYGDGPEREKVEELIKKYQLEDQVLLMGQVMNPYKYILGADLFVVPSIYEPFGLVIVEAMTIGVPVLATKNAATEKLIQHKKNGYIVENNDKALYDGICYLMTHQEKLKEYKQALKDYQYDNSKIIKQIEEVLEI